MLAARESSLSLGACVLGLDSESYGGKCGGPGDVAALLLPRFRSTGGLQRPYVTEGIARHAPWVCPGRKPERPMAECPHGSRQLTSEGDSNRNGDVDDAAAAAGGKSIDSARWRASET